MLENKWKDIAPEVPYDFHEKFEETLSGLIRRMLQVKDTRERRSVVDY